jgi:hypothetical protein
MSNSLGLVRQARAVRDERFFSGVYQFEKGGIISPDPIPDRREHRDLYSHIIDFMKPTRTLKRSIGAVMLYALLEISKEFYGTGDSNFKLYKGRGRQHIKNQLKSYCSSMSALEVVYATEAKPAKAKATVGRFDEHSTRHELGDLLDLVRTPEWRKGGSYEIVYAQSPGDLVSDEGRDDIVIDSSLYKIEQAIQAHIEHFRTDKTKGQIMPGKRFNYLFREGGYKGAYERVNDYLTNFEGIPDEMKTRLNDYRKRVGLMAALRERNDEAADVIERMIDGALPHLPTEEQYINKMAQNVAQTGGVLILEGFQQQEVDGFKLLQEDGKDNIVRLYTRVVDE